MKMTLISTTILSLLFFCFGQIINASEEDKSRWNKRYDTGEYLYGKDPLKFLKEKTLQKFSQMFIEYHYGYNDLKEKLTKLNFSSTISRPTCNPLISYPMQIGDIFSEQNNLKR